jgi:hypothetical protein
MLLGRGAPVSLPCCRERSRPGALARRGLDIASFVGPAAVLALLPKCPLCIAAYLAAGTGLGIAISTAAHLRMLILVVCMACLVFMVMKHAVRWMAWRRVS